jgi:hypothetical protein
MAWAHPGNTARRPPRGYQQQQREDSLATAKKKTRQHNSFEAVVECRKKAIGMSALVFPGRDYLAEEDWREVEGLQHGVGIPPWLSSRLGMGSRLWHHGASRSMRLSGGENLVDLRRDGVGCVGME